MSPPSLPAYDIAEPLGEGGMGQVYRARDARLDRVVALKFLSSRLARDETARSRFKKEARMAASVDHPNVCSIFEIGEDDRGVPFIAMTYCPGPTLADRLAAGQLSEHDVRTIAIQAASALHAAHERGIVHRDVKPSNISFADKEVLKVLDFGIASLRSGVDSTSEIEAGTAAYMSPEQVQALSVDGRTDVWALGIVLYECLTGVHPFKAPYDQATIYNILNSDPKPLANLRPGIQAGWQSILDRCLARDPDRRFQSMADFMAAIQTETGSGPEIEADGRALDGSITGGLEFRGNLPSPPRALIGRSAQRTRLTKAVMSNEGTITTVVVSGQSGIGKSQLVMAALGDAAVEGARALIGRCAFNEGVLPYHPFVVALKQGFGGGTGFDPAANLQHLAEKLGGDIRRRVAYLQAFLMSNDDSAGVLNREQLWDSVLALYRTLASDRHRLVVVVDDLQWADEATLAFFSFLARSVASDPIRLVGVYRLDATPSRGAASQPQLVESLRQLRIEGTIEEMPLEGLDDDEAAALVRSLFDEQPVSDDIVTAILAKTAGHPLFISEMVSFIRQEGIVNRSGGVWQLEKRHAELDVLPQRVQDVIHQRLGMLDPADRELLEVASMEGDRFSSETIASCLGWSRIDVLKRLQILESQHRLIHHLERGYRFDHSLIRQTLYDGVLPELREEYHRIIADVLVENHGEDVDFASRIARHIVASGRSQEAVPYLLKSAARARSVYALDQALAAYTDLEGILQSPLGKPAEADDLRLEVALGMGEIHYLLGQVEESLPRFEQAATLARQTDDAASEFEAIRKLASSRRLVGQLDDAMSLATDAMSLAEHLGNEGLLIRALHTLTDVHSSKGEYSKAIEQASRALDLSKAAGDLTAQSIAQSNLGFSHWHQGAVRESLEFFVAAQSTQRTIGDRPGLAMTLNFLALAVWKLGRYEEAIASASESVDIKRQIDLQRAIPGSLNIIGDVYRDLYYPQKALEFHRQSFALAESHGNKGAMCDNLRDIGADYLIAGDVEGAASYFQQALDLATSSGIKWYQTRSHLGLAEAALSRRDLTAAVSHAEMGHELADAIGARELLVEAEWTLARSMTADEGSRTDEAISLLERSFEEAGRLGLESLKWQIGVDFAAALSRAGDQNRSHDVLDKAAGTLEKIAARITDTSLRTRYTEAPPVAHLLGIS